MNPASIIVITGASRGLGRATARRLAREGHRVVATARQVADLEPLRAELAADGHTLACHALDVTDAASVTALAHWLRRRFDHIDVLINNAGISDGFGSSLLELAPEVLATILDTNLFGVLRVTQALFPLLQASRAGRIVNLSSGMGQLAEMGSGAPAYRISKTALNALTRILAAEPTANGIKVNALCPGWCRTDLGGDAAPRSAEEGIDSVIWLATLPDDGPSGGFFRDRQAIPW